MQDFSSNTPITIWLDPQNPDNSIIDKSAAEGIALLLGVCVFVIHRWNLIHSVSQD